MSTAMAVDDRLCECRHSVYVHELRRLPKTKQMIRARCTHGDPTGACACLLFKPATKEGQT